MWTPQLKITTARRFRAVCFVGSTSTGSAPRTRAMRGGKVTATETHPIRRRTNLLPVHCRPSAVIDGGRASENDGVRCAGGRRTRFCLTRQKLGHATCEKAVPTHAPLNLRSLGSHSPTPVASATWPPA